jgi:hypothetical protein
MFNLREFLHNGWDGRRFRRRTPTPPTQNNMVGTGAGARTNTRKGLRRRMSKSGIPASVSEEHIVEYETSGESGGDFRLESWKNRHGSGAESSADDESEGDMPKAESTDAGCFV